MLRTIMLALVICGCAGPVPTPQGPVAEKPAPAQFATAVASPLTRKATFRYEIRGRPFPLPVISGTIAGHDTLMLVDTGANSHVVAAWFARKIALPLNKVGDMGTDHVGKAIATYRI